MFKNEETNVFEGFSAEFLSNDDELEQVSGGERLCTDSDKTVFEPVSKGKTRCKSCGGYAARRLEASIDGDRYLFSFKCAQCGADNVYSLQELRGY